MIDNDPDLGVCMSWEEENPAEDVPPVSELHASRHMALHHLTKTQPLLLPDCMLSFLQSEYHIVYFGKPVSRAWVEADDVEPFTENCPQTEVLDAVSLPY